MRKKNQCPSHVRDLGVAGGLGEFGVLVGFSFGGSGLCFGRCGMLVCVVTSREEQVGVESEGRAWKLDGMGGHWYITVPGLLHHPVDELTATVFQPAVVDLKDKLRSKKWKLMTFNETHGRKTGTA
ncbi:hypothetical protein K438DRAFT_1780243 [Mycena galopus ATCC 62051]|nr:hypothetical protein K438DRAFT_1780243 [Mycena galopus ATCC 62051]